MLDVTILEAEASAPPDEPDSLYEVVNGQVVEPPPMGTYECLIAAMLDQALGPHAKANGLGRVVPETLFRLMTNLERRPDVGFVSYDRWPRDRRIPRTAAWEVVPDLAVEVVSPSNRAIDVPAKLREYFRAGVRLVWVVYPDEGQVYVYDSTTSVRILGRADDLDGGAVLPGFRLPLAELFEDEGAVDLAG